MVVVQEALRNSERYLCGSVIPVLCIAEGIARRKTAHRLEHSKVQTGSNCCVCIRALRAAGWVVLRIEPYKNTATFLCGRMRSV